MKIRSIRPFKSQKPYHRLFIEHGVVIAIGLAVFLLDDAELVHYIYPKAFLLVWATFKAIFFLRDTIRRIVAFLREKSNYFDFIKFVGVSVMLIVGSFSVDYWCLYRVEATSFTGISPEQALPLQLFQFAYFSICTFVTVGFGDVVPVTVSAKYMVLLEMCLSFISIILIVSNFSNFKEAVGK
ncbi:MAG: ion channel [Saprospiraceae bacterium]